THQDRNNFSGLSRAADLIGQLSDPNYLLKISALFYEFEEVGTNKVLGYKSPADLRRSYAKFYWDGVYPYIPAAINYLELTQSGKQIIANLYANVFQVEHEPKEKTNGKKLLDAQNKGYINGDISMTTPVNKKKFSDFLDLNL
ncbi:MAG: metal-dependent phosphohydrolase, partial [Okeania sp. SIO3H1]|nr:metal-dependent phosphohydrolase [Okeania sp. SIO3H1]